MSSRDLRVFMSIIMCDSCVKCVGAVIWREVRSRWVWRTYCNTTPAADCWGKQVITNQCNICHQTKFYTTIAGICTQAIHNSHHILSIISKNKLTNHKYKQFTATCSITDRYTIINMVTTCQALPSQFKLWYSHNKVRQWNVDAQNVMTQ